MTEAELAAGLANEDWRLEIVPRWKQRREDVYVECVGCKGEGGHIPGVGYTDPESSPNWDSVRGRLTCTKCWGSGKTLFERGANSSPPNGGKMPEDFIKHMRDAYHEYCRVKLEASENLQAILNKY